MNESKNDTPLADWVSKNNIDKKSLYISDTTSLDIKDFKAFILERKNLLKAYLKGIVGAS